ncbi:unnamed protein product [Rotaria sp. Silwood1]|nr:unnamed protein product [Rotaria sp. Silwood1]CAF5014191.1 unnamed protein product [Rotaria sp. Silwood1]
MIDDDDDHEYSPIETLIINDCIRLDEINDILSYFPNLHRLSIDYLDDENNCQFSQQINCDKINHVRICGTQSKNSIINYFPNAIELTFDLSNDSITVDLNRILPLSKLRKLAIECYQFPFKRLIKLLYSTVNLNSLKIRRTSINDTEYELIQQSEFFQMISNKNMIKNLIIDECCTLTKIQLFVDICPQLQQLTSGMN